MTDYRANLGAHRRSKPCEHCGTEGRQRHDRTCPKAKAGRSARRKGNDFERQLVRVLDVVFPDARRTGMYGGPDDVMAGPLFVQAKKVASLYPKRIDKLLTDIEPRVPADQYPAVVVAHPGRDDHHKLIVMDLYDFVTLLREVQK